MTKTQQLLALCEAATPLSKRLKEISYAIAETNWRELSMRVPADPERDADLVTARASVEIERLNAEIKRMVEVMLVMREALSFYMTPPIGQLNDHHIEAAKRGVAAIAAFDEFNNAKSEPTAPLLAKLPWNDGFGVLPAPTFEEIEMNERREIAVLEADLRMTSNVVAVQLQTIRELEAELKKRDKCSYMGPMRDCPTHGEDKDAARYRWLKRQPWVKTKGIHAWGALLDDAIDEARHDAPDETPNVEAQGRLTAASSPAGVPLGRRVGQED